VLTFFDYLRQRAFESVLSGAQEALEFLESQKTLNEPKRKLPRPNQSATDDRTQSAPKQVEDKSEKGAAKASDENIPPPRDRGRPMNRSKGNK
jgi:hypothetical protein